MIVVYILFCLFSFIWLGSLFIGPYLSSTGLKSPFFIQLYYIFFKMICHQNPDRSYFIWGYQMPVCVRCFGIYLGIVVGLIIYPFIKKLNNKTIPSFKFLYLFLGPIIIDGLAQTLHLYPSPHYIRLATGMIASTGLVFYMMPLLSRIYSDLINYQKTPFS